MSAYRIVPIAVVAAAWLFVVPGCTGDSEEIPFCESEIEATFDPLGKWMIPFPSNYYLTTDPSTLTGFRIDFTSENVPSAEVMFDLYPTFIEQLNQLDGFGTTAAIAFGFSDEIGTRDDSGESPVVLMDITEGSPTYGQSVPVFLEYLSDIGSEGEGQFFLLVEPAFPLRPKTTYAAALTIRLTDEQGACIAPSAATRRLLAGKDLEAFGLLGAAIPEALALLEESGFITGPGDLSALTVFTTQSIEEELLAATVDILERARSSPPRIVDGSLQVAPGSDGAALVVTGRFETAIFQTAEGTFVIQDGRPVVQGTEEIEFELVVPEPAPEHQPPFPVVIYQHGLLGTKDEDMGAKQAQARAGFASLAIDAVLHGSRAQDDGIALFDFFAIDISTGNFDMPVLRDNFRQAFLDIVHLAELAPALAELDLLPQGDPDGVPELSGAQVYLSGHSLGAVIAAGAVCLSPRIPIANLCAGGGSLPTNLFMRSELFSYFIDALRPEGTSNADVRRFMPILQILVERGDPANLARLAIAEPPAAIYGAAPKHVLSQEVIDDGFVPNESSQALGRALGQEHLRPVLHQVFGLEDIEAPASLNHARGVTNVFFQFDRLSDGQPAGHTEIYADTVAQTQWIHFFTTFDDTGSPEAIDPYEELDLDRR